MSTQHVFELTEAQEKAIKRICNISDITFHVDGYVSYINWGDNDVKVWTFRKDGSYVLEERDFFDGWSTYNFDAEEELVESH